MSYDDPNEVIHKDGVWIDATPYLLNGWTSYSDSAYGAKRFCKIDGVVYINLMIASGNSTSIMTLPSGYRPGQQILTNATAGDVFVRCDILTSGAVTLTGYNATWTAINVSFVAAS